MMAHEEQTATDGATASAPEAAPVPASTLASSTALAYRTAWYREASLWLLVAVTIGIYLPRLTTLTIRGEESRRAVIAREMVDTGDWLVPRTQGVPRLSRPPLQNWMIAGIATVSGGMSSWAIRLPGVGSTLLTVILIYWYARGRLQPFGALVSGLAYVSMLQVLEQGRTGETEPVFTAMVAASQLIWHGGRDRGWKPAVYWSLAGACGGLAMLTKGLQAPIYFFAPAWCYLLLTGHWRCLLSWGHAAGCLAFAAVVGAWQVPFALTMGLENSKLIYLWNVTARFHDRRTSTFLLHLLTYPPSILFGCLAPWSILLFGFTRQPIRQQIGPRRDMLTFLLVAITICFPSVWWPPEARPRYFMPLFPAFAVLIGLAAELLLEVRDRSAARLWTLFVRGCVIAMGLAALGVTGWSLFGTGPRTPPLASSLIYSLLVLTLGGLTWQVGVDLTSRSMTRGALAITVFLGLSYVGPMITSLALRSENLPARIAVLRTRLPDPPRLVSFDHVHHVFVHYFGEPVRLLPVPESLADVPDDVEYFCLEAPGLSQPELPFAWELVDALPVDRNRREVPELRVIVGRIVRPPADGEPSVGGELPVDTGPSARQ